MKRLWVALLLLGMSWPEKNCFADEVTIKLGTIAPTGSTWHTLLKEMGQKWGEATLVKFLTTGLGPNGKPAGAPMPIYKMSQDDAEAIVDYLKSLK